MALCHADFPSGFTGLYGTTASYMLNGMYADMDGSLTDDPDPNITGTVMSFSQNKNVRKVLPTPTTTAGVALRYWSAGLPAAKEHEIMHFKSVVSTYSGVHVTVAVDGNGYINVYRGTIGGTLLGSSSGPVIVSNAWQHIEAKVLISDTVGTVEVRVEGVPVVELTGQDTANNADLDIYGWAAWHSSSVGNPSMTIKDLVIWDGSGSLNNDFLGSVSVYPLLTTSDVSLNWTPSTGSTGYDLIDESPPNDDTDYIYAPDPAPAAAVMGLSNLPADVTSVKGLYVVARSKKTDGGDGNLQVGLISNAATALGSDRPITTSYTYWADVFETDPDTSAAWTPVAVDAADIQFDRTV